jgi:hypothetical protein
VCCARCGRAHIFIWPSPWYAPNSVWIDRDPATCWASLTLLLHTRAEAALLGGGDGWAAAGAMAAAALSAARELMHVLQVALASRRISYMKRPAASGFVSPCHMRHNQCFVPMRIHSCILLCSMGYRTLMALRMCSTHS